MTQDRIEFQLSFRPLFRWLVLQVYAVGTVIWLIFDYQFAREFFRLSSVIFFIFIFPVSFILSALLSSICIFILRKLFKLRVSPDGIDAWSSWTRRHVSWSEVEEAKYFKLLGLKYLKIPTTAERGSVWIPLFVSNLESLADTMNEHVPENSAVQNELKRALSSRRQDAE